VLNREARQFPEDKKVQLADYVIKNDESELVIPQILKLHDTFLSLGH
jgi:dephospho-CoA kinase